MPRIVEEVPFDGATERISRLGLTPLLDEIRSLITGYELLVEERKDANGGAYIRKLLDERFQTRGGWTQVVVGDVDWTKCQTINGTRVCIGVELQVSGRSDLVAVDLIHLRARVISGELDVGVLVVPSDRLAYFLTDRVAKMADAKKHAREARVEDWPLLIIAFEHDGAGPKLPKQAKRSSVDE